MAATNARVYWIRYWRTMGVLEVIRGDQLGNGKLVVYLDEEKSEKMVAQAGQWFREPERAVRAVDLRRKREMNVLQKRINRLKELKIEIRRW